MSRTIRAMRERRRERRITLRKPVLATVNAAPVFVLDISNGGMRVAHRSQLPPPGAICRLAVPAEAGPITLDCAIVHTVSQHAASAAESVFQSGLRIVGGDAAKMQKVIRGDKKKD
jgi:hypothetical protein